VFREVLGLDEAEYANVIERKIAVEDYLDANGQPE
jgi:hypothetical protein